MASQVAPFITPNQTIIASPDLNIIASLEKTRLELLAAKPFVVTPKHQKNIEVYLQILSTKVQKNAAKKRAQRILQDVFDSSKQLFLLCAFATNLTFLATIRDGDSHWGLVTWWEGVPHPPALATIKHRFEDAFETKRLERPAKRVRVSGSPAIRAPAPAPCICNLRRESLFDFLATYQGGYNILEMAICGGIGTLKLEFKPGERAEICIQQDALGELLKRVVGDILTGSGRGISIPCGKLFKFIMDYRGGCPGLLGICVSFDVTTSPAGLVPDSVIPFAYEGSDVVEVQISLTPSLQHVLIDYVTSTYGGKDKSGLGLDFKLYVDEGECTPP